MTAPGTGLSVSFADTASHLSGVEPVVTSLLSSISRTSSRRRLRESSASRVRDREQPGRDLRRTIVTRGETERAAERAREEQRLREREERRAREKTEADKAATDNKEQAERELEQSCAGTRSERLADLKDKTRDFHAELKKLGPHLDWIEKHCKHEDTRGILVQRQRVKDGVIVRTKQVGEEYDVTCDAPLPKGVTKEMANRATYFNSLEADDPLVLYYSVDRNRFGQENSRCASADRAAGVDLFVKVTDMEAQKAILAK
jgi:hypothetical protein